MFICAKCGTIIASGKVCPRCGHDWITPDDVRLAAAVVARHKAEAERDAWKQAAEQRDERVTFMEAERDRAKADLAACRALYWGTQRTACIADPQPKDSAWDVFKQIRDILDLPVGADVVAEVRDLRKRAEKSNEERNALPQLREMLCVSSEAVVVKGVRELLERNRSRAEALAQIRALTSKVV